MRAPSLAVLALLLGLALAGCTGDPREAGSAAQVPSSSILEEVGASVSLAPSKDAMLLLPLRATPEGALAAAWWTIPEGVLGDSEEGKEVRFIGAPLVEAGRDAELERWLLVAFLEEEDGLAPYGFAFGAPLTSTRGPEEHVTARSLAPFPFRVSGPLEPGDRIAFVVAAVASAPVDLALALAPAEGELVPPATREAYLDANADAARAALPVTARAGPHMLTILYQLSSLGGDSRTSTGTAKVEHSTTGVGALGMREVRVSHEFPARGATFAFASYGNDAGVGEWSAAFDLHGVREEASGELRNAGPASLDGIPLAAASGEGEGPARGELRARVTSAATGDSVVYFSVDLGATLTELLGIGPAPVEPGDVKVEGSLFETILQRPR